MAQLSSPGVSVTVVDESFYTPAAPGTVPLIIVATQQDKMNSAGTGIAPGTTKANAGKVYLLTSQMDLGTTFGVPYFQTDAANNPVHAGELNEYGLQAAYSFLGVSSRAYVVRADVDTSQLEGSAEIPTGDPVDGAFWLNTATSAYGVFEWNANVATTTGGQTFTEQQLAGNFTVITDITKVNGSYVPLASYGQQGNYALVALTTLPKLWYKKGKTDTAGGTWVQVGTSAWKASWPAAVATSASPTLTATGTQFTGQIAGTTLTVTSAITGGDTAIGRGSVLANSGNTITAGTSITAVNSASFTGTVSTTTLNVTSGVTGTLAVGMVITGITPAFTYISALGTGTGGTGTYILSASATGTPTAGTSYTVSATQTVATGTITTGSTGLSINSVLFEGVSTVDAMVTAINVGTAAGITASNNNGYLTLYSTGADIVINTDTAGFGFSTTKTYEAPVLVMSSHMSIPPYGRYESGTIDGIAVNNTNTANGYPTGSVWVKTTAVNRGAQLNISRYSSDTSSWIAQPVALYANGHSALAALDPSGGGINLAASQLYVKYNDSEAVPALADFKVYFRGGVGPMTVTSSIITTSTFTSATTYAFTVGASQKGSAATPVQSATISFVATANAVTTATALATAFQAAVTDPLVSLAINADNSITITHSQGGDLVFVDGTNTPVNKLFTAGTTKNFNASPTGVANNYLASWWYATVGGTSTGSGLVTLSANPPTTTPADGTLWYDTSLSEFDILVHNGAKWCGYTTAEAKAILNPTGLGSGNTDANGPIISATQPKKQSDGSSALANGDLWIDTSNIEDFPKISKYDFLNKKWIAIDVTDQTSSNGVVFGEARWNDNSALNAVSTGAGEPATITALLATNYVDEDCPDPALYPKGILLWNLRRSGYNVKKYQTAYVDTLGTNERMAGAAQTNYYPDRWVSAAANSTLGVAQLGRKAQRAVVLQEIQSTIQSNTALRSPDTVIFNLLSCPGYTETFSSLIGLNTDNGLSAFIVMDPPARLAPDATTLSNWGNNTGGAAIDGPDGLIATNSYAAIYYPWAFTQDLLGNNVVVPPSHIMLRTIALSDNVSYPWFAPAGVRRGGVTNASSVGYVNSETGEFNTVALNLGQRDVLAGIHVNPITYLAGTGLVVYGQKTRQLVASSLDRINVARLVIYLRYQLNQIAKPYIFEPNDQLTRNQIKKQIESLMLELTAQRALYDFIVVCDTSNNTPARIDRSELWVDVAIEPVKAVEFIYIPMRLENTGAIKGL